MQRLIDPLTLKDPINAPPDLDYSWRYANSMAVMGIRWDRY